MHSAPARYRQSMRSLVEPWRFLQFGRISRRLTGVNQTETNFHKRDINELRCQRLPARKSNRDSERSANVSTGFEYITRTLLINCSKPSDPDRFRNDLNKVSHWPFLHSIRLLPEHELIAAAQDEIGAHSVFLPTVRRRAESIH